MRPSRNFTKWAKIFSSLFSHRLASFFMYAKYIFKKKFFTGHPNMHFPAYIYWQGNLLGTSFQRDLRAFWNNSCNSIGVHWCIYTIEQRCFCGHRSKMPARAFWQLFSKNILHFSVRLLIRGLFELYSQGHPRTIGYIHSWTPKPLQDSSQKAPSDPGSFIFISKPK